MNNEGKAIMKLLDIKTRFQCNNMTEKELIENFLYILTEYKRLEA